MPVPSEILPPIARLMLVAAESGSYEEFVLKCRADPETARLLDHMSENAGVGLTDYYAAAKNS